MMKKWFIFLLFPAGCDKNSDGIIKALRDLSTGLLAWRKGGEENKSIVVCVVKITDSNSIHFTTAASLKVAAANNWN